MDGARKRSHEASDEKPSGLNSVSGPLTEKGKGGGGGGGGGEGGKGGRGGKGGGGGGVKGGKGRDRGTSINGAKAASKGN